MEFLMKYKVNIAFKASWEVKMLAPEDKGKYMR